MLVGISTIPMLDSNWERLIQAGRMDMLDINLPRYQQADVAVTASSQAVSYMLLCFSLPAEAGADSQAATVVQPSAHLFPNPFCGI